MDYCPLCRGVWLDRGELDKLIERQSEVMKQSNPASLPGYRETWGEQEPPAQPRQGRSKDSFDEDYKRGRRKKRGMDFLGDIFDF